MGMRWGKVRSEEWLLLGGEVVVSFVVVWRHRWWPLTACCLPSEQQSFVTPYVRDLDNCCRAGMETKHKAHAPRDMAVSLRTMRLANKKVEQECESPHTI